MSIHGADIEEVKRKYNIEKELIDFSSNINPNTPLNLIDYVNNSIHKISSYPDLSYVDLRNKISESLNYRYKCYINLNNICVGNGATELIFLLMKCINGKLGIISPTFSEYERAAKISGTDYENIYFIENEGEFEIPTDEIDFSSFGAILICNPNNPEGRLRDLSRIVSLAEKYGVMLIIDETFIEFCREEIEMSLICDEYCNIVVLRAITKFYGIPGIRMGYCVSQNIELIDSLWKIKEPWTVNSIAENVTKEIIFDEDFIYESKKRYDIERKFIIDELNKISGIYAYNTDSAFILIKIREDHNLNSTTLKDKLISSYGIIIRDASNFNGLNNYFVRIAIKSREDNIRIIKALKEIFGLGGIL